MPEPANTASLDTLRRKMAALETSGPHRAQGHVSFGMEAIDRAIRRRKLRAIGSGGTGEYGHSSIAGSSPAVWDSFHGCPERMYASKKPSTGEFE